MKYFVLTLILTLSFQYSFGQRLGTKEKRGKLALTADNKRVTDYSYDLLMTRGLEYATVKKGDLWGLINDRGEEVLPHEYDHLEFTADRKLVAARNGKFGILDYAGKEVIPFRYEKIDQYFPGGAALVKLDGQWGVLRNGTIDPDISKVVFEHPDVHPLFAGTNLDLLTEEERLLSSYSKLIEFININILLCDFTGMNKIEGTAAITFVLNAEGQMKSPRVVSGIGTNVAKIALELMKKMPVWASPAMASGQPVAVEYTIPLTLDLKVDHGQISR